MRVGDTGIVGFYSEVEAVGALTRQAENEQATTINTLCINLSGFDIAEIGVRYKNLRVIKMTGARFGNEGAEQVAQLIGLGGVAYISLEWCYIKEKGARAIVRALEQNDSICHINLWDNKIGAASQDLDRLVAQKRNIIYAVFQGCDGVQRWLAQRQEMVERLVQLFDQRTQTSISIVTLDNIMAYQNAIAFTKSFSGNYYDLSKEVEFKRQLESIDQYLAK